MVLVDSVVPGGCLPGGVLEYYSCKFSRYIYILQQTMSRVCTYMYLLYTLFSKCTAVPVCIALLQMIMIMV